MIRCLCQLSMSESKGHGSTNLITIPRLIGNHSGVRVMVLGATFAQSSPDGGLRFTDDQFGSGLIDGILRRQSILSKKKGIRSKTHHCRNCDADLTEARLRRCKFTLDMQHRQFPPFKVEVEMQAKKCLACDAPNALDEEGVELNVGQAIVQAFRARKIS